MYTSVHEDSELIFDEPRDQKTMVSQEVYYLIRIFEEPEASLEGRCHCVILLDKGGEKSKLVAQVNQTPEGKAYLEKAYTLLRAYYPMVQDLDDLTVNAKIPAIYPNCIHNADYLAFRASISTVSLQQRHC